MNLDFTITENELPGIKMRVGESIFDHAEREGKAEEKASKCRTGTMLYRKADGTQGVFRKPCGGYRVCAPCYHFRVEDAYRKIQKSMLHHPGNWQYKSVAAGDAPEIRRALETYRSFPQDDGTAILLSPDISDGTPFPNKFSDRIALLKQWVVTPEGKRMTSSRNCFPKDDADDEESGDAIDGDQVSATEVEFVVSFLGGSVCHHTADHFTYKKTNREDVISVLCWAGKKFKRRIANSLIDDSRRYETIYIPLRPEVAEILEEYDPKTFLEGAKAVLAG